ncbi:MAG: DNA-directed RNA polymerase subunit K [Candidatus Pacearchaeota archaeon]
MAEEKKKFSKYERARIIGARGLQISMDAPVLLKIKKEEMEEMNYDPLKIAERELDADVLPISVNRPMPKKKQESIEKIRIDEDSGADEEKIKTEREEEKDMVESGGEILDLANPEEELEEMGAEDSGNEDLE